MRTGALAIAAVILLAPPAGAQSDGKTPPPSVPSTTSSGASPTPAGRVHVYGQVYVGDRAPDFTLDGSDGKIVRPSRFRGDWVVLVFADRKEKFQPLETVYEDLNNRGVRILAVCKEKAHGLQAYATREKLPFVVGADWTGEVSAMYGLYDQERSMISPGFVLADRDGIVRMALLGQNLPPEQIAALVRFAVSGL
jgi:mycoredoxin-dependent peroxiredoxin